MRAVDNAIGVKIPKNARLIRNLMHGAQYQHDHIVHFYHLHALDWVDVVSALKADPAKTAALSDNVSNAPWGGVPYFKGVQQRLKTFVDSGQLGPFSNAYWGHPAYKLPPEANLMATAHYIEALRLQAKAARMHAIFGGKNPHPQFLVLGGVTCAGDLTADRIAEFLYITKETQDFIKNVYIPDLLAVASFYKDWGAIGGTSNFLAWGDFPMSDKEPESLFMPRGTIMKRDLAKVQMAHPGQVSEHVARSWYEGKDAKHPYEGETKPLPKTRNTPRATANTPGSRPRATTVSPARSVPWRACWWPTAWGTRRSRRPSTRCSPPSTCRPRPCSRPSGAPPPAASRRSLSARPCRAGSWSSSRTSKAATSTTYEPYKMPDKAQGVGLNDVPRGALGHWIVIDDKKIKNYQYVVPSTWNLGPRCAAGKIGPVEEALIGTPVADPKKPLEVLRTVHSFDPCIACAVHVIDPDSNEVYKIKAL